MISLAESRERAATNVLVVALDAAGPLNLTDEHVYVVAPAVNSRLRHWLSDDDGARRAAQERLEAVLRRLECAGVDTAGRVGDADPVQAIADALSTFNADRVVIAAHRDRSRPFAHEIAARARKRFDVPIAEVDEPLLRAA